MTPTTTTDSAHSLQVLPCKIEFDGHSAASKYFMPTETDGMFQVDFRGRRLSGKEIRIKAGWSLLTAEVSQQIKENNVENVEFSNGSVQEDVEPEVVKRIDKNLTVIDKVIVWEHDKAPLETDEVFSWFDLCEISESFHATC